MIILATAIRVNVNIQIISNRGRNLGRYRDGTWADHMIILATVMRVNVNIQIISNRGPGFTHMTEDA